MVFRSDRRRESIDRIEDNVRRMFEDHPQVVIDESGAPQLPIECISELLRPISDENAELLLDDKELEQFTKTMESLHTNPGPRLVDVQSIVTIQLIRDRPTRGALPQADPSSGFIETTVLADMSPASTSNLLLPSTSFGNSCSQHFNLGRHPQLRNESVYRLHDGLKDDFSPRAENIFAMREDEHEERLEKLHI